MEPKNSLLHSQEPITFNCLIQINPVLALPTEVITIHFNIILKFMPRSYKWSLSLRFPHQNPVCTCSVPQTCHVRNPSHSLHTFQCLCSEGEIVVDDPIHWKQNGSSTQSVSGITGHSNVPVEDDLDSSKVRIHTTSNCVTVVLPVPSTLCLFHLWLEFLKQNSLTKSLPVFIPPLQFI
jgi:hypothetical protein